MLVSSAKPTSAGKIRKAARRGTVDLSTTLYDAGLDNYLSVSIAQVAQLAARTSEVQVQVRQMPAPVSLVRAIGGGWSAEQRPTEKQTLPFAPLDFRIP